MEGRETYRFATKTLASSALAAIERAGLHPDEIDLVIPHQANVRIIEAVAKGLGFPMERIFVNAIMNSASFAPEGGKIRVAVRRDENGLLAGYAAEGFRHFLVTDIAHYAGLIAAGGYYADLYQKQMLEEELEAI